ncbi:MAG: oligosaccharide flippase family protein [Candidatus Azobacteroides sp.]|nr:oligosaccharide flippase family protein [Candidatus Azobacteroides sp.]
MNIKKIISTTVVKNIFYLGMGNGLIQLLSMLAVILITALLLPEEYGQYTFMTVQAQLIATIAELGMANIIIRSVARAKENKMKLFSPALLTMLLSNVGILLIYSIYNFFFGYFSIFQLVIIGLYSTVFCISKLCECLLIGAEKIRPLSIIGIFFALIWLFFVWLLPEKNISVETLFVASLLLLFFKIFALLFQIRVVEKYRLLYKIKKKDIFTLVKSSSPYFGLVLVALPANYLANNFLQINSTLEQVGFFSLGQKLTAPLMMLFNILFSALFPNISILWEDNQQKFYHVLEKGIFYFILFAACGAFLFSVLIKPVFLLLFSEEYLTSVNICKTQVWFTCMMGICNLTGTIWGAMNKEKLAFKMAVINSIINIPVLWFGSKYGGMGLSLAYVISFSIFMCILWPVFIKTNNINKKKSYVWIPFLALFIASFII